MIKRPPIAAIPIHSRDTVSPDDHRLRDEIELYYPSTYLFIKDRFCHVKSCKFDGECRKCPAGELRRYAARDSDRIGELFRDNSRLKHGLKEVCDRLWYYFGQTDGKLSNNQAQNVYDVAKFYLEGGTPSES